MTTSESTSHPIRHSTGAPVSPPADSKILTTPDGSRLRLRVTRRYADGRVENLSEKDLGRFQSTLNELSKTGQLPAKKGQYQIRSKSVTAIVDGKSHTIKNSAKIQQCYRTAVTSQIPKPVPPPQEPSETSEDTPIDLEFIPSQGPAPSVGVQRSLRKWFVDSKNPKKCQKYTLSLRGSVQSLKEIESKKNFPIISTLEQILTMKGITHPVESYQEKRASFIKGLTLSGKFTNLFFSEEKNDFYFSMYCALKALICADGYPDSRIQYGDFLRHMRNALRSRDQQGHLIQELASCLDSLCYDKFTSTYLFNYWDALLEELCGEVKPEDCTGFGELASLLEDKNQKLHKTDPEMRKPKLTLAWEKFLGTFGFRFDPVGKSNVPKVRSKQMVSGVEITRMAHGTPTIEGNLIQRINHAVRKIFPFLKPKHNAQIIPEYLSFLWEALSRGEKVLYVNLQKTEGLEGDRSDVINELQEDKELGMTFYSMSLPLDGSYFNSLVQTPKPKQVFKNELLGLFFKEVDGTYRLSENKAARLPKDLLDRIEANPELAQKVAEKMLRIIDRIDQDYFPDGSILQSIEPGVAPTSRQNFIMQFYSDVTDYITSMDYVRDDLGLPPDAPLPPEYRITLVVKACKDNKDRGGALNGVDEAKYILLDPSYDNDPAKRSQALYDLYVNTLGPYTIKFEEILPGRLTYLTSLLRHYATLTPEQIKKIRKSQPKYFQVEKHQSARELDTTPREVLPPFQTALSLKQFVEGLQMTRDGYEISAPIPEEVEPFKNDLKIKEKRETLKKDIQKDLKRMEILIDGKRCFDAERAFTALGVEESRFKDTAPSDEELARLEFLENVRQDGIFSLETAAMNGLQGNYPHHIFQSPYLKIEEVFREAFYFDDQKSDLYPEYFETILQSIDWKDEGASMLQSKYLPKKIGKAHKKSLSPYLKQLNLSKPRMIEIHKHILRIQDVCRTPEGRKKILSMLYTALDRGYCGSLETNDVFKPTCEARLPDDFSFQGSQVRLTTSNGKNPKLDISHSFNLSTHGNVEGLPDMTGYYSLELKSKPPKQVRFRFHKKAPIG